jgi:hypothetical protein
MRSMKGATGQFEGIFSARYMLNEIELKNSLLQFDLSSLHMYNTF